MEEAVSPVPVQEAASSETASRPARRDQQVQRILDAAKCCFLRSGFQGASMQHICAEAAMSPGALYRYFPSKEAIIEAIVEADRRSDAEVLSCMGGGAAPDGVVNAAMAYLRHVHERENAPLFIEIRAEAMRNPTVSAASKQCMGMVADMFHARLDAAAKSGEISPILPLDQLVPLMMATADGIAMNNLPAQGVSWAAIETTLRAVAEAMLRPRTAPSQAATA